MKHAAFYEKKSRKASDKGKIPLKLMKLCSNEPNWIFLEKYQMINQMRVGMVKKMNWWTINLILCWRQQAGIILNFFMNMSEIF